jgi:hypothetical protein
VLDAIENMFHFRRQGPKQRSSYDCGLCLLESLKDVVEELFVDPKTTTMSELSEKWMT